MKAPAALWHQHQRRKRTAIVDKTARTAAMGIWTWRIMAKRHRHHVISVRHKAARVVTSSYRRTPERHRITCWRHQRAASSNRHSRRTDIKRHRAAAAASRHQADAAATGCSKAVTLAAYAARYLRSLRAAARDIRRLPAAYRVMPPAACRSCKLSPSNATQASYGRTAALEITSRRRAKTSGAYHHVVSAVWATRSAAHRRSALVQMVRGALWNMKSSGRHSEKCRGRKKRRAYHRAAAPAVVTTLAIALFKNKSVGENNRWARLSNIEIWRRTYRALRFVTGHLERRVWRLWSFSSRENSM